MDKEIIARNFSRCACFYDRYANVQNKSGLEILNQMPGCNFNRVLEIGCGTGNYTRLLKHKFKKARITALDISAKMLEVARGKIKDKNIEFITADAESADFANDTFDLITSNACFQWFQDLEAALKKYKSLLKKGGLISFSIFGPLSFWELNVSLKSVIKDVSIAANNFINSDKINRALGKTFADARIKEMIYQESFGSIMELLNKIKYTGVRGDSAKVHLSRKDIKRLEEAYLNKFQRIRATYQILFCRGVAR